MSDKIDICLLDNTNKKIEEVSIQKPKTYYDLLNQLKKVLKNLPKNYSIFYLEKGNKEKEIKNNEEYKLSKDILFIREKKINLGDSLFESNYNLLSDSQREIIDEKYNCFICDEYY